MPRFPIRAMACIAVLVAYAWALPTFAASSPAGGPGCPRLTAQQCLDRAIDAMGGKDRLRAVGDVDLQGVGSTRLVEQSYRQQPFLTSYQHFHRLLDLGGNRVRLESSNTWPQAGGTSPVERPATVVVTPQGGLYRSSGHDYPAPESTRRDARAILALDPIRLLLTAAAAPDLHQAPPERLHGTTDTVLAFTHDGVRLRLLLNPVNYLPDALESTRSFGDFWYPWGDVRQRICYDNWILVDGIRYPTAQVEYRNGVEWRSRQVLRVRFNVKLATKDFALPAAARKPGQSGIGWERPFRADHHVRLAPGVDLYLGAWNTTLIRQDDGVVVLEAPISPLYTRGILAQAHKLYPKLPIKAVLSTSDSWPHVAGVREAVAAGIPVYVLDQNLPLLQRMLDAPHTLRPDTLAEHPRAPQWRSVTSRRVVGKGANRIELIPLRGADTARQYMVYFPARKLLYASDTLVIDGQTHALYMPELMHEVIDAARRAHLDVHTVYAMHQGPTPWAKAVKLVQAAQRGPKPLSAGG
jgi:hypothetical protein